jgi:hypothetical protein
MSEQPDMMERLKAFIASASTMIGPEAQGRLQAQGLAISEAIDAYRRSYVEQLAINRAELAHLVRLVVLAVTVQGKDATDEYANLQEWAQERLMIDEVPWRELNDLIDAHLGESECEALKIRAAHKLGGRRSAILRKANPIRNMSGAGPVASYSARLKARAGKSNGNRGS